MPILDLNRKSFDDATLTKLNIFEQYITEWLPTFIHGFSGKPIYIIDFFAGAGTDINGTPGSALRIFDVIERFKKDIQKKGSKIHVILNEFDKDKFNLLLDRVNDKMDSLKFLYPFIEYSCHNKDFSLLFDSLKNELKNESCFLFMDQNGVKQINETKIHDLEEFERTDFMFFISSSYFKRFGNEPSFQRGMVQSDTKINDIHRDILKRYREMLPQGSKTKLFPFSLKKKNTGNIYGLVFGSKHILAVEKFMRVAWSTNPINGEANFDIDNDNNKQLEFDFMEKKISKIDSFFQDLKNFALSKKEFTNEDVLIYTLENGFPVSIANDNLKRLRDQKILEHFSYPKIGYDQVYKNKDIVVFKVRK